MEENPGEGSEADRLCRTWLRLDHGQVTRGRVWVWVLGAVGVAALLYALVVQTFEVTADHPGSGLLWPLLGVAPLLGIGLFFTAFSENREGVYLVLAGAAGGVGAAFEAFVARDPQILFAPQFAVLNCVSVLADSVSAIGWTCAIATFPGGRMERAWQRHTLHLSWWAVLLTPATLWVSPTVYTSGWADLPDRLPNPYAVPALAGLSPYIGLLSVFPLVGLVVFLARAFFGDPATRRTLRPLGLTLAAATVGFGLWGLAALLQVPGDSPLAIVVQIAVYPVIVAIPVVFIHGVFVHGAFGVRTAGRATAALRSSALLIGLAYACAVAFPAVVLADQLTVLAAVVVTVAMALALNPVRTRAEAFVRRHVLGDPDRAYTLLVQLGARLEQTSGLDAVLDELAAAIRDGLRASWTRIRVLDETDAWSPGLLGRAGVVSGPPTETRELTSGGRRIGRVEVGPKRSGSYAAHELELLTTVSGQAATAVANVALAAQLEQRLGELSASRVRLVAAQDDERRRIERDLHDGIQQNVVALIAGLRLARNRLQRGELEESELTALQEQARETLADLREIAHGIHPPVLGDNGLVAAVESRAARYPIPLEVVADPALRRTRLSPELEATAYYVVSEALANVAKHSRAAGARVTLARENGSLRLEISDDGSGFDPTTGPSRGGLSNLRDRVAAAGGRLSVDSASTGTVVTVSVPIAGPDTAPETAPEKPATVGAGHG
jgi:signal transduction histidine kinase